MAKQGQMIFSGGADGYVAQWQPEISEDGTLFAQFGHSVYSMASLDGGLLVGCSNGILYYLSTENKEIIAQVNLESGGIFSILQLNASNWLVGTADGRVHILNAALEVIRTLKLSNRSIRSIIPLNNHFVAVCSAGKYHSFTLEKSLLQEKVHTRPALVVAENPYSPTLVSGGCDAQIRVVSPGSLEEIQSIKAHLYHIHHIAFHPSQPIFLTASLDKSIKLWDALQYQLLKVVEISKGFGHTNSVNKVLWIGDKRFISCSDDRKLMVWDLDLQW